MYQLVENKGNSVTLKTQSQIKKEVNVKVKLASIRPTSSKYVSGLSEEKKFVISSRDSNPGFRV